MPTKRALIFGSTGLVGGHLLRLLCESPAYSQVVSAGRRTVSYQHPRLEQQVVDMDRLAAHSHLFAAEDCFICLGTTIKKAGSQAAFRQVDLEYPVAIARLAKAAGASRVVIVTAVGGDPASSIFYNRTKGEVERELISLGLPALHIVRPSLILGERQERRFGEAIAMSLSSLLSVFSVGPWRKYRPIHAQQIAAAMLAAAQRLQAGVQIYEWDQMMALLASPAGPLDRVQ